METGNRERFPLSIPALGFIIFAFYTLARTTLAVDVSSTVAAKAGILFQFLIGGLFLAVLSAIILDKSFKNILPDRNAGFTTQQSLVVLGGFALLGFFQLIVNTYSLAPLLVNATPTSQQIFSIDAAIAEEAVFSALLTVLIYRLLLRSTSRFLSRLAIGLVTALIVAVAFLDFHSYVYGTNPTAQVFVFGARIILVAVYLVTKSLVAVMLIHATWNYLSFTNVASVIPHG